jgi:DNA-directed RNA polymerase sigma subunit (sigma70/sigma32)
MSNSTATEEDIREIQCDIDRGRRSGIAQISRTRKNPLNVEIYPATLEEVIREWAEQKSPREISIETGVPVSEIYQMLKLFQRERVKLEQRVTEHEKEPCNKGESSTPSVAK